MDDPRQIAGDLTDEERRALLSLTGESDSGTVLIEMATRLQDRGLAVVQPDGLVDLSDLGWQVLDILNPDSPPDTPPA